MKPARDPALPWRVLIDGKKRGGQLWGKYATRAGAAATARELRRQGFLARAVGPETAEAA